MSAAMADPPLTTVELADVASPKWPVDRLVRLIRLWRDGMTTVQMGLALGATKNAIVGKVHRLIEQGFIESRPSPIRGRDGLEAIAANRSERRHSAEADARRRAEDEALQTFRKTQGALAEPKPKRPTPIALNRPLAPKPPERTPIAQLAPRTGRVVDCCWPFGEPGTRSFRFCDQPSDPGRPYCQTHARKAYVRISQTSVQAIA